MRGEPFEASRSAGRHRRGFRPNGCGPHTLLRTATKGQFAGLTPLPQMRHFAGIMVSLLAGHLGFVLLGEAWMASMLIACAEL